mmetsp:Transcript_41015/g.117866  ORF Transcript_41015/g.117866 Transcript_41015/m.117866 type:complete len:403 (-) Transcript_41015:216-1424(-)
MAAAPERHPSAGYEAKAMDSPTSVFKHLRGLVSGKKKRFQDGVFDLDLAYVTPRVIAMGYPSVGLEVAYRNPATEVRRFLESRHQGHYKVFNLCSERDEDMSSVFGRVEYFPFCDHHPCPLDLLTPFCQTVHKYLAEDPENVVAIHCKAGKGRTGLVISAYLLHAGICETADQALQRFAEARTHNAKGVTIPSQIRYVHYYESLLHGDAPLAGKAFQITRVRLQTIPSVNLAGGGDLYFKIRAWKGQGCDRRARTMYSYRKETHAVSRCRGSQQYVDFDCAGHGVYISGDAQVVICSEGFGSMHSDICSLWFNTRFCEDDDVLCFAKSAIDGARKDAQCKRFAADFAIQVFVRQVDPLLAQSQVFRDTSSPQGLDTPSRETDEWFFSSSDCDSGSTQTPDNE